MDPDIIPASTNQEPAPNVPVNTGTQVFDITEDSISPVTDESDVSRDNLPTKIQADRLAVQIPEDTDKRASPPPEENLLDRRIGSFETSAFGAPGATAPVADKAAPVMSQPIPPKQPPSPPAQKPPYRETIDQTDLIRGDPPPQIPTYTRRVPVTPAQPMVATHTPNTNTQTVIKPTLDQEIAAALGGRFHAAPILSQETPKNSSDSTLQTTPAAATPEQGNDPKTPEHPPVVVKPLRTYEGDIAAALTYKHASTTSLAMAESRKQQTGDRISDNEPPSHVGRNILMMILILLLLGGGIFGAYYLYSQSALAPITPTTQPQKVATSIVPSDTQIIITLENKNPTSIIQRVTAEVGKNQQPNTIKEIILASREVGGTLTRMSATDVISSLDVNTPDVLVRSLTPYWMLGVHTDDNNHKGVFVVVTTNFFQNTFAGMLQWERFMPDDLRSFLYPEAQGISNESISRPAAIPASAVNLNSILPSVGSTTASTSPTNRQMSTTTATSTMPEVTRPLRSYTAIRGKFEDRIVKNKDVRSFRTDDGSILFLYSFIDSSHLVITADELTLAEILNRLEKQSFVR